MEYEQMQTQLDTMIYPPDLIGQGDALVRNYTIHDNSNKYYTSNNDHDNTTTTDDYNDTTANNVVDDNDNWRGWWPMFHVSKCGYQLLGMWHLQALT